MKETPNYYSIITADVRYSKEVNNFEKILYSEITALSNKLGYCNASNRYFALIYGKHQKSIQRNISNLKKAGFIEISKIYDGKQIKERRLYLKNKNATIKHPGSNIVTSTGNKVVSRISNNMVSNPSNRNVTDNITSINITSNNKDILSELSLEATRSKIEVPYFEIIEYLNLKAGTKYKSSTRSTQRLIKSRWQEGFDLNDFKCVIDVKVKEWSVDKVMFKYLRPETLFGNKFESYLNQKSKSGSKSKTQYSNDDFHF